MPEYQNRNPLLGATVCTGFAATSAATAYLWNLFTNDYASRTGHAIVQLQQVFPSAPDINYDQAAATVFAGTAAMSLWYAAKCGREFVRRRRTK